MTPMPRRLSKPSVLLLSLIVAASPEHAFATDGAGDRLELAGPPPGFEELEQSREFVVDLYFGGAKVGEARVLARPGAVTFRDAAQVLGLVPNVRKTPALAELLNSELPANSGLACAQTNSHLCGKLSPELAGIIFDEERFRIDLFIHPDYLEPRRPGGELYLPSPTAPFSLTSSVGLALSDSGSRSPAYNFQNRTIVGFRNMRVRSDSSFASGVGILFDDLVGEIDTDRHRYSAGLFWAPGLDFTGRRRIAGIGFGTQFDRRADRETLNGSPLIVFLSQPARIEILVDGRLVASGAYEAGNAFIDTSGLPSGSYPLVLRIREPGGGSREERRFFAKNAQVPPMGEPVYFAYAGMLANTRRHRPISLSKSFFSQIGMARRLSDNLALDAALLGTDKKAMIEAGAWLLTGHARVRAAGLVSSAGGRGLFLQLGSASRGRLNFNFDLRRVWSGDGKPLIPLPFHVDNFGSIPPTGAQVANGSYTQASGSVAFSLGAGYVSAIGSYRRDRGLTADYSIGPSLTWPVVNRNGLQLVLQADAQRTRTSTATFVGFRVLFASRSWSMFSSSGRGSIQSRNRSRPSATRAVGSLNGQWSYQGEDQTQISLGAGFERGLDSTTAELNGLVNSRFGNLRADVLHNFKGRQAPQYGLNFQTGVVAAGSDVELGGRDLNESALIVSMGGSAGDALFEVLIDGLPRGRLRAGSRLPIFLQPYRAYEVRVKPMESAPVNYDSQTRKITLFPGSVEHLSWNAESVITLYGQAVHADGRPVVNALVQSRRGIGQTDEDGYFQVDASDRDSLVLTEAGGNPCEISLNGIVARGDYAPIGKVLCR